VSRVVLDASALLAILYQEPGGEGVLNYLPGSLLSAVNLSEVVTKSVDMGMTLEEADLALSGFPYEVVAFDAEHASVAASLRAATRPFGLSLGDRACLALGLTSGLPVLTADRKWGECRLGVEILKIR